MTSGGNIFNYFRENQSGGYGTPVPAVSYAYEERPRDARSIYDRDIAIRYCIMPRRSSSCSYDAWSAEAGHVCAPRHVTCDVMIYFLQRQRSTCNRRAVNCTRLLNRSYPLSNSCVKTGRLLAIVVPHVHCENKVR